jgi:hypothetical protein
MNALIERRCVALPGSCDWRVGPGITAGAGRAGAIRRLEGRHVAPVKFVRSRDDAFSHGDPEDSVACRRLVSPAIARLQAHGEVIDR